MIGYPYSHETDWHQSLLITFKASFKEQFALAPWVPNMKHDGKFRLIR